MSDLSDWSNAIDKTLHESKRLFDLQVEYLNKQAGKVVMHTNYLIDGVIVGGSKYSMSMHPRVIIQWYNGAETIEHISNLVRLEPWCGEYPTR